MALKVPGAGELRIKVRFERRVARIDPTDGNEQGEWAVLFDPRWVKLSATRGGEITVGDRMAGRSGFDLWLRADSQTLGVRPSDRAIDITIEGQSRVLDIKFAEPMDDNHNWILMQAEAVQGEDGRDDEG